ncbi:Arm DNA-binding domain-containing protein [Paracandidimonas soli]|nr:Arm DNA-binding domain-containing protein [Paracandidimonas soli]
MLNDGDNLYLRVRDTGKVWIYRYTKDGKRIKLGLGPYPEVTLAQARAKAYEANSQRANGSDPKETRDRSSLSSRLEQRTDTAGLAIPQVKLPMASPESESGNTTEGLMSCIYGLTPTPAPP